MEKDIPIPKWFLQVAPGSASCSQLEPRPAVILHGQPNGTDRTQFYGQSTETNGTQFCGQPDAPNRIQSASRADAIEPNGEGPFGDTISHAATEHRASLVRILARLQEAKEDITLLELRMYVISQRRKLLQERLELQRERPREGMQQERDRVSWEPRLKVLEERLQNFNATVHNDHCRQILTLQQASYALQCELTTGRVNRR
mmetsp:Transcript_90626/g.143192  ORF Transcript_90626/g.143192 Transcript_90626/m.143192 type:complete len:202 (-) Transcript_90626:10-615(-)